MYGKYIYFFLVPTTNYKLLVFNIRILIKNNNLVKIIFMLKNITKNCCYILVKLQFVILVLSFDL